MSSSGAFLFVYVKIILMADTNKPIITGEHFYKFFQCPHWLWHDIYSDSQKRKEIPPLVDMIYRGGIKHKNKAIQGKPFDEIDEKFRKALLKGAKRRD